MPRLRLLGRKLARGVFGSVWSEPLQSLKPPFRKLSQAEKRELQEERRRRNITFRVLARKFGVSVWTAHRLCTYERTIVWSLVP